MSPTTRCRDYLVGQRVRVVSWHGHKRLVGKPARVVAVRRDMTLLMGWTRSRPVAVLDNGHMAYVSELELLSAAAA